MFGESRLGEPLDEASNTKNNYFIESLAWLKVSHLLRGGSLARRLTRNSTHNSKITTAHTHTSNTNPLERNAFSTPFKNLKKCKQIKQEPTR